MIGTLALLALLLVLSGFFSGAEIALFSLGEPRVRALAREKRPGARALEKLKQNPERLLITILIGNNVANIGGAAVATYTATELFGSAGVGLATGVMTLLVLVFGEVTPKSFAARNAERLSLLSAPFITGLGRVLLPVVLPFEWLVRRVLPDDESATHVSEWEIRAMARLGHQAGDIEAHERQFIDRVFTLDRLRAREIMTPRVDILAWEDSRSLGDIAEGLTDLRFSRIPIYGESLDDVTGVLYRTEAYRALLAGEHDIPLARLAREPYFVPESVTLIELLEQFRARRVHMGLVVDEHGGLDGLVTLEDILEELVGDIVDETDEPEEPIVQVGRNEIVADGGAELREINHFFGTAFPVLDYRSLNGFLLGELGRVPEAGEYLDHGDVRIHVLATTDTQVTRARIRRR
ncbi:hemolysin family protein [Candidatus Palauibacter sp.]|uniref:hemolysin family protein n=1 Tax=Candidatus Palauibacter sp. TaxID=3101350 RepID=UPI003B5B7D72